MTRRHRFTRAAALPHATPLAAGLAGALLAGAALASAWVPGALAADADDYDDASARQAAGDAEGVYLAAEHAHGIAEPIAVADLRSKFLDTDQVMLEYLVGADGSVVALVSQDRCRSARIAAGADSLHALVGAMVAGLRTGDSRPAAAALLYDLLIAPLASDIPPEARLVLVPDGPLGSLPFAALFNSQGYLVERHPLSQAPSAAALRTREAGSVTKLAPGDAFIPAPPDSLARESVAKNLPPDVVLQRHQRAWLAKGAAAREWSAYVASGRMRKPRRGEEGEFPLWLVPIGVGAGALLIVLALRLVPRATDTG